MSRRHHRPQPARERILDTAFRLFYAHGPRGVGVDTVIAESGVAKATLYKHFPRKDDLVLAYLDRVDQAWFGQLRAAARPPGDDPRDQLVGMFDALGSACRREGYHGCAFINTAAESDAGQRRARPHRRAQAGGARLGDRPGPPRRRRRPRPARPAADPAHRRRPGRPASSTPTPPPRTPPRRPPGPSSTPLVARSEIRAA